MARTYKRDSRGRFASGGGGSGGGSRGGRGTAKPAKVEQGLGAASRRLARARAVEARGDDPLASRRALTSAGTGRRARLHYQGKRNPENLQFAATVGRIARGKKPSRSYRPPSSKLPTPASKSAPAKKRKAPATTTARGRALRNQRRATDLVRAGRGGSGPSKKAVRSAVTAMRARAYYAATGTGTKRSAKKAVSAAKNGKQIRALGRAKAAEARAKVAGRPKARVVAKPAAKPAAQRLAAKPRKVDLSTAAFERRAKATERRARKAEKELAQVDRFNPANKRIRNRAYALRSAADSYSSLVRRGAKGEFSAGYLFQSGSKASRRTTAPKLSRSEKAAITRAANAAKKTAANIRRMEQARRFR